MTSATSDAATATGARHIKHRRTATSRGVSALMYASQQGNVDRVRKIIREQSSALLTRDRTGKTPLHYCCTSDNICAAQAADLLVMAAPDLVEGRDEDGFTPLHLAVIAGNMPLVTFLLANKADVNAVDNEKHTVVHWATVCGETAALTAVLAAGASVSTPDVHGGYPLHYAAQMCGGERDSNLGIQVLQALLTHSDIVVSVADGDGRQPLLWAASAGSAKAVLALVRAGASVEAHDKDGLTALHCAASRGHTDCIDSLLTLCGASPDVIDSNGCTALHYAVTLGHADATALLLAHGADPNRQDRKGRTPAHCGCAKGQFETVKLIGGHGANLWLRNARGDLPLHEAAASGRRDLVRWLLDMRPSQVNARNNDGRCPLHLAAMNDNADMCKILLDAGAQINPILRTSKNTFMTPLDCALQRGFRSTAKYLQLHGGVPANRLGDLRQGQATTGINLQIKDDVAFWGDTSSDSERENGEATKHSKKIQRKKLSHKYEKKRASLSGSDIENNKFMSSKLENGRNGKRRFAEKNQRAKTGGRSDSAASIDQGKHANRKPSGRFANEIVINGQTAINIHHTKHINIGGEEEVATKLPSKLSTEVAEKVLSEVIVEKEKRPKSAKSAKGRDSAKKKVKVERPNSKQKQGNLAQSKQEVRSEEKIAKTDSVPTKNEDLIESETIKSTKLPDQQSLMSNTSEDVEEHKNLVVEAAVHEPPKTPQKDEETEAKEETKENETKEDIEPKTEARLDIQHESNEVSEKNHTEKQVSHNKDAINQEAAEEKMKEADCTPELTEAPIHEIKAETIETKKASHESEINTSQASEDTSQKIEELRNEDINQKEEEIKDPIAETEKLKVDDKTVAETDAKNDETSEQNVKASHEEAVSKSEADVSVVTEQTDSGVKQEEEPTKGDEEGVKKSTLEEKSAAVSTEDKVPIAETTTELTAEAQDLPVSDENLKAETESATHEKVDEDDAANKEPIPKSDEEAAEKNEEEINKDEKSEANEEQKGEAIQEKALKKQKSKKQNRRKKQQSTEDQAYEIIYKTMGADEDDDVITESEQKMKRREKLKPQKTISETKSSQDDSSGPESDSSTSSSSTVKEHKSFRILDEKEAQEIDSAKPKSKRLSRKPKSPPKKQRSRSEEKIKNKKEQDKTRRSKIPTPLIKSHLSKSDKYLNVPERKIKSSMESRVPSLPNINESKDRIREFPRSDSNLSAPLLASIYSDNEKASASDLEEEERSSATRRKKVRRKPKTREARSAESDYESSNVIDSGFEPSPRSSRIPKWKNMTERGVNMSSVTQSIQTNIRRYHLERKIFQHLLDLKRMQIRAGQHNEALLVKRAIDQYHQSCASTVGAGRYVPEDYSFKSFEKFLYLSLRKLQRNGADYLKGLPESPNPLLCTQSTHRCMHATHAYTGIPCAAYLPKMDHHTIPKIGFGSTQCKPGTGFLPTINPKKAVTLELCHGNDKQVISLPADRLDQNKRYYVTFTVKGSENAPQDEERAASGHRHSKSD